MLLSAFARINNRLSSWHSLHPCLLPYLELECKSATSADCLSPLFFINLVDQEYKALDTSGYEKTASWSSDVDTNKIYPDGTGHET
jgi:hypothetical protein